LKITAFWEKAPRSFVEVYRRFRRAYCLHQAKTTSRYTPEGSNLLTYPHKNLKSH